MSFTRNLLFTLALSLSPAATLADSHSDMTATLTASTTVWVNQSGSVFTLMLTPSSEPSVYVVGGNYVNKAAGTGCQNTPYPVTGYFNNVTGQITFDVSWKNAVADCNSMTAWAGYVLPKAPELGIETQWTLVYQGAGGTMFQGGVDTFAMQDAPMMESLVADQ